jgi:hypothetical protein
MRASLLPWCRAVATGAVVLLFVLPSSYVAASTSWHVALLHQDPVAILDRAGHSNISISLRTGGHNGDADALNVSVYSVVTTRSDLAAIVSGIGASGPLLSSTGDFPLNCRIHGVAHITLTVSASSRSADPTCGDAQPDLSLNCVGQRCDGVYPISFSVTDGSSQRTIWSLLAVTTSLPLHPVGVAWVLRSNPGYRGATAAETRALQAISQFPTVPLAIGANYAGTSNVNFALTRSARNFRSAMALALRSAHHQLTDAPPASVDFGALRANSLAADVVAQARYGGSLVRQFTGKGPKGPLVLSGSLSVSDIRALGAEGIHNVLVNESSLNVAPSLTLQWGTPFHITAAGTAVTAVSIDAELSRLSQSGLSPGLRSALELGTLALLHFQAPFAPAPRIAVVESSLSQVGAPYVSDFLSALRRDPLIVAVPLSLALSQNLVGANGYPRVRTLAASIPSAWTRSDSQTAIRLDANINDFATSISSLSPIVPLRAATLLAEVKDEPGGRSRAFAAIGGALTNQLRAFSIVNTTITLTGSGADLPITLTSSAGYSVTGVLTLSAPKVRFPSGNRTLITLNTATRAVRVPADIHGSGNFTLVVELLSAHGSLVLAHGAIQVRSTATSVLGYVLTFAALLVIAAWWYRTTRRKSRGLHAA